MATDLERLKEGAQLAQEGRYDEALTALERLLLDSPEDADVLFMIGACHYKKGNSGEARSNWQRVLRIDPEHAKAQGMLAKLEASDASQAASKPLSEAQKAVAEKASKKKPAPAKRPWKKYAIPAVLAIAVIALAADMLGNPQSYPFLGGGQKESETPQPGGPEQPYVDPAKRPVPLETGLPGRWYFNWENDPTTLTFEANGNVSVIRTMQGGNKLPMQGTYSVEGDTLKFHLTYKQDGVDVPAEEASMYNAKIQGVNLTFNFLEPKGPEVLAVKQ